MCPPHTCSLQDFVNRAAGGATYGPSMPPELMQNPYGRLAYGQPTMNMYTQNQPLPPGQSGSGFYHFIPAIRDRGPSPFPFHRRTRIRSSAQTFQKPTNEQNDVHTAQLPRHDAWNAG